VSLKCKWGSSLKVIKHTQVYIVSISKNHNKMLFYFKGQQFLLLLDCSAV